MVNFTTPNLPGASDVYNKIASKVDSKDVMSKLEVDASALVGSLTTDLLDLKVKTASMIPELPSLPSLNLQAEITALSSLIAGSSAYTAKLASIGTSFGSSITAGGYDINSIATAGASALAGATGSLTSAIPNMELPAGATEAIEVAKASILPTIDAVKEDASKFSTDETVDEVKGIFGDAFATNTLTDSAKALASAAETAGKVFNGRVERLSKELKEVQRQERLDE
jgi:hypothetical protein